VRRQSVMGSRRGYACCIRRPEVRSPWLPILTI